MHSVIAACTAPTRASAPATKTFLTPCTYVLKTYTHLLTLSDFLRTRSSRVYLHFLTPDRTLSKTLHTLSIYVYMRFLPPDTTLSDTVHTLSSYAHLYFLTTLYTLYYAQRHRSVHCPNNGIRLRKYNPTTFIVGTTEVQLEISNLTSRSTLIVRTFSMSGISVANIHCNTHCNTHCNAHCNAHCNILKECYLCVTEEVGGGYSVLHLECHFFSLSTQLML